MRRSDSSADVGPSAEQAETERKKNMARLKDRKSLFEELLFQTPETSAASAQTGMNHPPAGAKKLRVTNAPKGRDV